ncbi:MAG: hypothetical protein E7663_02395 [Ruminococcaceae bacterium]|nr:hypothetical protein [Oscillospiraceae bacterium]
MGSSSGAERAAAPQGKENTPRSVKSAAPQGEPRREGQNEHRGGRHHHRGGRGRHHQNADRQNQPPRAEKEAQGELSASKVAEARTQQKSNPNNAPRRDHRDKNERRNGKNEQRAGSASRTEPHRERRQENERRQKKGEPTAEVKTPSTDLLDSSLFRDDTFEGGLFSSLSTSRKTQEKAPESAVDTAEFEVDIATAAYLVEDIPCGFPTPDGKAVEVIGVRFRHAGKVYFFAPGNERFRIGEAAIVDTARGPELGEVVMLNRKVAERQIIQPLRPVLRRATKEDLAHYEENQKKEQEALLICSEKIARHELDMHLVDAQYSFDNSKLLFYFTSEGRVDFRELVRDLAGVFRTRIELRQIGIRDESRLIGGLGMCGRPFCCTTFLSDFGQVSVKMAKEQGLSINTSKISGCCGRLMCCLRYEHEAYAAESALTPRKDARVSTPDGMGTVVDSSPLAGTVKVRLDSAPEEAPVTYHRDRVTVESRKKEAAPAAQSTRSSDDSKSSDMGVTSNAEHAEENG